MSINKNTELLPYYEKARELLNYDPETGELTWKESRQGRGFPYKKGDIAGAINPQGYRHIKSTVDGVSKTLKAHRIAWFIHHNELPDVMDHANGVKDDNRIVNLRDCDSFENRVNTGIKPNNTSGFRGVRLRKDISKWQARITFRGKRMLLGNFSTPEEASQAYEAKAKELFGEFYKE